MEVGPLVVLGLMWVVLNALRKGGSRPTDRSGKPPTAGPPTVRPPAARTAQGSRPEPRVLTRLPGGDPPLDATQREGSQLEHLLRELGRTLDQAGQQGRRPTVRTLPPSRPSTPGLPAKKGESLVTTTEGQSLELEPARGERAVEDLDDEAERVVKQRLTAVEAHQQPLSDSDHQRFDQQVRQEVASQTAARAYTLKQLRDAVVWGEILGPPASLRREGGADW